MPIQINVTEEEAVTICSWKEIHATLKPCDQWFSLHPENRTVTFRKDLTDKQRMRLKLYLGFEV